MTSKPTDVRIAEIRKPSRTKLPVSGGILFELADMIGEFRDACGDFLAEAKALREEKDNALAQNAVTMLDNVSTTINGMVNGVAGEDGQMHVSFGYRCLHCGSLFDNVDEAKEHDSVCESHPAVIRAKKAEAERDALAAELEENRPFLGGVMYAAAEMVSNGMDDTIPLGILKASGDWEEYETNCNEYDVERFRQAVGEEGVNQLRREPISQQQADKEGE